MKTICKAVSKFSIIIRFAKNNTVTLSIANVIVKDLLSVTIVDFYLKMGYFKHVYIHYRLYNVYDFPFFALFIHYYFFALQLCFGFAVLRFCSNDVDYDYDYNIKVPCLKCVRKYKYDVS